MKKNKMTFIVAGVVAAGLSASATNALAGSKDKTHEKCYGIVKAQKNDCGTAKHSCAGQAKTDGQGNEWIYLPKGTCEKIVDGSLTPENDNDAS